MELISQNLQIRETKFESKPLVEIINDLARIELSFSSELRRMCWFGWETLLHEKDAINFEVLNANAPLLLNHTSNQQIGSVVEAELRNDRKCTAIVQFSRSDLAQQVLQDIKDGIRTNVSVGYTIEDLEFSENPSDDIDDEYDLIATKWTPREISIVGCPADHTVGISRSNESPYLSNLLKKLYREKNMPNPTTNESSQEIIVLQERLNLMKSDSEEEKTRVNEILSEGKEHNMSDLAREHVMKGTSLSSFRSLIMKNYAETRQHSTHRVSSRELGLTSSEKNQFSFLRAISALASPADRRSQEAAAFEFEVSNEAQKLDGRYTEGI